MTPEEIQAIAENIRKIIAQGGDASVIDRYLAIEGLTKDQWLQAASTAPPSVQTTEPTPIGTGNPTMESIKDVGALLGQGVGLGLIPNNEFIDGMNERANETRDRHPILGTALTAAPLAVGGAVAAGPRVARAVPGIASKALKNRFIQGLGLGGAGRELVEALIGRE